MSCCPAIRHSDLAVGAGTTRFVPAFIPWACVFDDDNPDHKHGSCIRCGTEKLLPDARSCPTYRRDTNEKYPVMVWAQQKIQNTKKWQWELTSTQLTFGQLVDGFLDALAKARKHYVKYVWSDHVIRRLKESIDPDMAETICTDFAATMNLRAKACDNSNVDAHAVLQVFQTFRGHRKIPYTRHDGSHDEHLLTQCVVDQFIGGTESKGKSHDHQYHTACLLALIKKREQDRTPKYNEDGKRKPFVYYVITDDCSAQYKCRQNFIFMASICNDMFPNNNIRIEHVFANKYRFKGTWDGEGKVTKFVVSQNELKGIRGDRSVGAFLSARANCTICNQTRLDVEKLILEGSEKITKKMVSTVDCRTFWYVTSCRDIFAETIASGAVRMREMVFVDRQKKLLTKTVEGTTTFSQVRGESKLRNGEDRYQIVSSTLSCACDDCLKGLYDQCPYLAARGNVKSHLLMKEGIGNWE